MGPHAVRHRLGGTLLNEEKPGIARFTQRPGRENTMSEDKKNVQTDKRKQSLYFPEEMLSEIKREALRQDRSLSWIVQQAWRIARDDIRKFPSINTNFDSDE
jgi:uncharacterized small protein (TIGR04563 family)